MRAIANLLKYEIVRAITNLLKYVVTMRAITNFSVGLYINELSLVS